MYIYQYTALTAALAALTAHRHGRTDGGDQELEGAVCGSEIDFDLR